MPVLKRPMVEMVANQLSQNSVSIVDGEDDDLDGLEVETKKKKLAKKTDNKKKKKHSLSLQLHFCKLEDGASFQFLLLQKLHKHISQHNHYLHVFLIPFYFMFPSHTLQYNPHPSSFAHFALMSYFFFFFFQKKEKWPGTPSHIFRQLHKIEQTQRFVISFYPPPHPKTCCFACLCGAASCAGGKRKVCLWVLRKKERKQKRTERRIRKRKKKTEHQKLKKKVLELKKKQDFHFVYIAAAAASTPPPPPAAAAVAKRRSCFARASTLGSVPVCSFEKTSSSKRGAGEVR